MFWNLKFEMQKSKISTTKLAEIIGISQGALRNKIYGRTEFLLCEVKKIATVFPEATIDYLFEETKETKTAI